MKFSLAVSILTMLVTPSSAAVGLVKNIKIGETYQFKAAGDQSGYWDGERNTYWSFTKKEDGNSYMMPACFKLGRTQYRPAKLEVRECVDPKATDCSIYDPSKKRVPGQCVSLYVPEYGHYEFFSDNAVNKYPLETISKSLAGPKAANFCVIDADKLGGSASNVIFYTPDYRPMYFKGEVGFVTHGNAYASSKGYSEFDLKSTEFTPFQEYIDPDTCKPETHDPTTYGDPHFKTWSGEQYDFHGGCDLVLMENPKFANGLGMKIHIRTSIRTWWSFIERAAIQIGENTLEITGGITKIPFWIDGVETADLVTGEATLGDFPVKFKRINDHQSQNRIDLGNGDAIAIETFKDFVRVNIKNKSNKAFVGSAGLLGAYPNGQKVGRDGKTIVEDPNAFGQEWMVLPTDGMLFHSVEGGVVQHPTKCLMPDQTNKSQQRRRLGGAMIKEEDAALACARVSEKDRDACIFDVLATQDAEMAGSY